MGKGRRSAVPGGGMMVWICVIWIVASIITMEIIELIADGLIGP